MNTKFDRALKSANIKSSEYIEKNRRYFSHDYCVSQDQLQLIRDTYYVGFMAGVTFK